MSASQPSGNAANYVTKIDTRATSETRSGLLARVTVTGESESIQYYHFDELGSTRFLTSTDGVITDKYTYDAHGNVTSHMGGTQQPYQYVGAYGYYTHYQDQNLPYIQTGFRLYSPGLGRYIQEDPAQQGVNWYAYSNNNPVSYLDPTGLSWLGDGWDWITHIPNHVVDWFTGGYNGPTLVSVGNQCANQWSTYAGDLDDIGVGDAYREAFDSANGFSRDRINDLGWIVAGGVIKISPGRWQHVLDGHIPGGRLNNGKSTFTIGINDILNLIRRAGNVPGVKQANGYIKIVVNAGRVIGIDRNTGLPTTYYTVIVDTADNLITAYPGW